MLDSNRDFKGVWIPREIWLDNRLSTIEKIVLIEVDSLDIGDSGCFASNEYLAEFCQCSQTKVSNAISKLIELGYLELKSFDGRQRVLQSRLTKFVRQTYTFCEADTQNLQDSNIVNNIVNNRSKKENKKEKSQFDNMFLDFCKKFAPNEATDVFDLLCEWLKVRTAKRSANTERAIKLNLDKLESIAEQSGMSVADYLKEVIMRGWVAFYKINKFTKKGDSKNGTNDASNDYTGCNFGTVV